MRGHVEHRGGDAWRVRVSLGRDPSASRYRSASRTVRGTKRDAQRAVAQLVVEVDHGGHRVEGRHTVAELMELRVEHIEMQGRARPSSSMTSGTATTTCLPTDASASAMTQGAGTSPPARSPGSTL